MESAAPSQTRQLWLQARKVARAAVEAILYGLRPTLPKGGQACECAPPPLAAQANSHELITYHFSCHIC